MNWNQAEETVKRHVKERLDRKLLAGVCAGVWKDGERVLRVCMGERIPQEQAPMTENTLFRMASMTKPITGTAAMQLWERGLLSLDDPVSKWLPEFLNMQVAVEIRDGKITKTVPAERQITPRMLLTHSAGLGCGVTYEIQSDMLNPSENKSREEIISGYSRYILEFEPGARQSYSAFYSLDVLTRIIEMISDMNYHDYLKKYIFEPLEMEDTTYLPNGEQQAREMAFAEARDGALIPEKISKKSGFSGFPVGYVSGGAGLFSTLSDYSHFAQMLTDSGSWHGRQILTKTSVDLMGTPQLSPAMEGISDYFNWGLSVRVCSRQGAEQPLNPGSFGWSGAYGTHFWIDRSEHLFAIFLSNLVNGGGSGAEASLEFERDVMEHLGV